MSIFYMISKWKVHYTFNIIELTQFALYIYIHMSRCMYFMKIDMYRSFDTWNHFHFHFHFSLSLIFFSFFINKIHICTYLYLFYGTCRMKRNDWVNYALILFVFLSVSICHWYFLKDNWCTFIKEEAFVHSYSISSSD